jgi:hypothetical protein
VRWTRREEGDKGELKRERGIKQGKGEGEGREEKGRERGAGWGAKLGNRSDDSMKRCDEALNASSLQFLCQR